jgi:hypothetical protein
MRRTTVRDTTDKKRERKCVADETKKTALECHARRHMSGAVFKTYDAMLAMAKSKQFDSEGNEIPRREGEPLIFKGRVNPTLANHTNTSPDQLSDHIRQLLEQSWLYRLKRVSYGDGKLGHWEYSIVTHDQFVARDPGPCPPFAYAQKKDEEAKIKAGDKISNRGKQPAAFALGKLGRVASKLFNAEVTFNQKRISAEGEESFSWVPDEPNTK